MIYGEKLRLLENRAVAVLAAVGFMLCGSPERAEAKDTPILGEGKSLGSAAVTRYTDFKSLPADCAPVESGVTVCPAPFKQCAKEVNGVVASQPASLSIEPKAKGEAGKLTSATLGYELGTIIVPLALNVYTDPVTGNNWMRDCRGTATSRSYLQVRTGRRVRPINSTRQEAEVGNYTLTTSTPGSFSYRKDCRSGKRVTLQFVQGSKYRHNGEVADQENVISVWHLPCKPGKKGRLPNV